MQASLEADRALVEMIMNETSLCAEAIGERTATAMQHKAKQGE